MISEDETKHRFDLSLNNCAFQRKKNGKALEASKAEPNNSSAWVSGESLEKRGNGRKTVGKSKTSKDATNR
jgi:hypothetical protein